MNNERTNIWLIVIAIVGLILSVILNLFFSYLPLAQIEARFNRTADDVEKTIIKVEQIAEQVNISTLKTADSLERLNRFEEGICTDIGSMLPTFCS
jgi:hypothetical protein